MEHIRNWINGVLVSEIKDGIEVTENLGKTQQELGIKLNWSGSSQTQPKFIASLEYKDWPIWAKALKKVATPEDKGIGDVVARMIGPEKSAAFKSWFLVTFGRPCNCNGRQERWNKLYPLNE